MLDIETASFPAPWHRVSFEGELLEKTSHGLVVKQRQHGKPDRLIAYVFFRLVENEMHVLNLAVHPVYRRRGVATFLLQHSVTLTKDRGVKKAYLEVRPSNDSAIKLYSKMGFSEVGRRHRYYKETQEDAIVMVKDICKSAKRGFYERSCRY
ncbi:MAG: ribosomal protein S18-alanine N-acetyltransferase [Desulfobacterales bacterium]|nr:ribosomal protein S18-alanine N-acetyltransferase [Desulfobacterales bacterium]